jgi:arylsulfatase A-like enzyme
LGKVYGLGHGFVFYDDWFMDKVPDRDICEKIAPHVNQSALQWLDENQRKNFFLWVHYIDPHGPYTPPLPFSRMFPPTKNSLSVQVPFSSNDMCLGGIPKYQVMRNEHRKGIYMSQYDGEIAYMDDQLGLLLKMIHALGLDKNSLVIITADHGESLGEHNYFFGHSLHLYEDVVHVPLIIGWRGRRGIKRSVVQHVDLFQTILETVGASTGPSVLNGRNIIRPTIPSQPVFAEMHEWRLLVDGNFSLLNSTTTKSFSLFDLSKDPGELHDLAGNKSGVVQQRISSMKRKMEELGNRSALSSKPTPALLSPDAIENLKSLGYTQ